MSLKERDDIHMARRIWHALGVLFIFGLYFYLPLPQATALAIAVGSSMIVTDLIRLRWPPLNNLFVKLFSRVLRESEKNKVSGSAAMMAGVIVIIMTFSRPVVLLTLLFLAFGDPIASYFGIRFGKDKLIGSKSLQGTLAAFAVCFVLAVLFFHFYGIATDRLFVVGLLAGLVGAVSELVPVGRLDDNFVFPVVSAALLTGLLWIFGGG